MPEAQLSASDDTSESTTLLVRVTDIVYHRKDQPSDGSQLTVTVTGRDEHGDRWTGQITGIRPYIFAPQTGTVPDTPSVLAVEDGYESYDGIPLNKLTLRFDADRDKIRDLYDTTYESDIPFERRISIDYGLSGYIRVPCDQSVIPIDYVETEIDPSDVDAIDPRVLLADIEAMPPSGNVPFDAFVEGATGEITAITFYDTGPEETVALVLDPDGTVRGQAVKDYVVDHWADADAFTEKLDEAVAQRLLDQFTGPIQLVRCEDESTLLETFIREIESRTPDLLSGWNWIDFDHRYILNRIEHHYPNINEHALSDIGHVGGNRVAQKIDGLPGFDMMGAFCDKMTFSEWRSKRLDYVADEELGVGKVDNLSIHTEYDENRSRFLAYNIIDTQLLVGLDEKHGIHEFFYTLGELSNIQVYDTKSELRLVDGFMMGYREDDEILPAQDDTEIVPPIGGLVLTPSNGIEEYVGVFDLKSLYPSSIITCNISPETMVTDPAETDVTVPMMPAKESDVGGQIDATDIDFDLANGAMGFSLDEQGIIPKYLRLLFKDRAYFKDRRNEYDPDAPEYAVYDNKQGSIKVIMNSFYGVLNNQYYRLAKQGMGDAITSASRYVLWKGAKIVSEMDYRVIYGDTDSCMFDISDADATEAELIDRGYTIETELNTRMDEVADAFGIPSQHPYLQDGDLHGTERHIYKYEYEKLYRRFFQAGTKKRYAGKLIFKEGKSVDKLDITGFESERADVPVLTEKTQKEVIEMVLDDVEFDALSEYVQTTVEGVERMASDRLPDGVDELWDLGTPGAINKPLDMYPNMPTPRACKFSNQYLDKEWKEGDDPWIYPIKATPPMTPETDYVALDWGEQIPEGYTLDTAHVIEKKFHRPIKPVLDVVGWSWTELKTGAQVQGVDFSADGDTANPFAGGAGREAAQTPTEASDADEGTGTGRTDDAAHAAAGTVEDDADTEDETDTAGGFGW